MKASISYGMLFERFEYELYLSSGRKRRATRYSQSSHIPDRGLVSSSETRNGTISVAS